MPAMAILKTNKTDFMSEQIKNTLFRMASLRAPQLLTEQDRSNNFIFHPGPFAEGAYAGALEAYNAETDLDDHFELLNSTEFSIIKFPNNLKELVGETFYNLANFVASNRHKDESSVSTHFEGIEPLENDDVVIIWDNLFYQLIKNESPVLREQLIQVLVANHLVQLKDALTPDWWSYANARVALPKELFGYQTKLADEAPAEPAAPTLNYLKKETETAQAKSKMLLYQKTVEDFRKAERAWQRENKVLYEDARKDYEASVADILANADTGTDTNGNTYYIGLEIPPFNFTPTAQLLDEAVLLHLSDDAATVAEELELLSLNSFEEVFEKLEDASKQLAAVAMDPSSFNVQYASINNMLLPVGNKAAAGLKPYPYTIKLQTLAHKRKVFLSLDTGDSNGSIIGQEYHGSPNVGGSLTGYDIVQTSSPASSILVMELFAPTGIAVTDTVTSIDFDGSLTLDSGVKLTFSLTVELADGEASGYMDVDMEQSDNQGSNFIPSGYGITRLGIADYQKVEQSVCCYVPGEVSHIENVMAREYKERSSRKLRRSEDTTTTESQMEKESLSDSTSTSRHELQQEVSAVLNESSSQNVNSNSSMSGPKFLGANAQFGLSTSFAHNVSQQESNRQAVTNAQEITERALERVVQKVREERVTKIVEEFEESNKHGFDNRRGDKHISAVYRWVDKVYKNQVLNYGKRLMYEFMVPQPASFHLEAMKALPQSGVSLLTKPVDPKTFLPDASYVTAANYQRFAAAYNADVEAPPVNNMSIGTAFSMANGGGEGTGMLVKSESTNLKIPEGYFTLSATAQMSGQQWGNPTVGKGFGVGIGNSQIDKANNPQSETRYVALDRFVGEIPVSAFFCNFYSAQVTIAIALQVLPEHLAKWQGSTFTAIVEAYETKLAQYNEAVAASQQQQQTKPTNPAFYRQVENTVLRKNCISTMINTNQNGTLDLYKAGGVTSMVPILTKGTDSYANLAKFMEQAFEWDQISYTFYPFYWANKSNWQAAYQQDVDDALFRSFLQAGYARVVATVRPGFEEAVMHYMATGQVWNGGQVPVIGDDLYLSIVQELQAPPSYVEQTWETRVPTTLTAIQNGTIVLTDTGLPCECDDDNGIEAKDDDDHKLGVVLGWIDSEGTVGS